MSASSTGSAGWVISLPLARQAREVLGIEGSEQLVARSRENVVANGIATPTTLWRAIC